jgi:hypothetical protein
MNRIELLAHFSFRQADPLLPYQKTFIPGKP